MKKHDIEIKINGKDIFLTLEEGEILLEKLYIYFKDKEEDYFAWEKSLGIPPVDVVLEDFIYDDECRCEWFRPEY
jgi:hypothetical protein